MVNNIYMNMMVNFFWLEMDIHQGVHMEDCKGFSCVPFSVNKLMMSVLSNVIYYGPKLISPLN